jgi:hypothetical protein
MSIAVPSRPSPFRQKTVGTGVGEIQGVTIDQRSDDGKAFQQATIPQLSHQDSLGPPESQVVTPRGKAVLDEWDKQQEWLKQERKRVAAKKNKSKAQTGKGRRTRRRKKRRRKTKRRKRKRRKTRRKRRRRTRRR